MTRRACPAIRPTSAGRYIEAAVNGILVGCLYLPNGNPQPGPKFDYKLAWFERLIEHARSSLDAGVPVVLAGDYNVVPTELDIYPTTSWHDNALLQPESRAAFARLLDQGWTDALREQASATSASTPSGTTCAIAGSATRGCGSTICCSARRSRRGLKAPASTGGARTGRRERPCAGMGNAQRGRKVTGTPLSPCGRGLG